MSSTIRGNRDVRWSPKTMSERRGINKSTENQKTYDARMTSHSSSTVPAALSGEPSKTDMKVDHVHEIITGQLAPRTQTLSANALLSDRREFYYYFRKKSGRRCSCFLHETSPDSQCPICFGTGVVGGYEKYGTRTEVLDYTLPDLVTVNMEPNFGENTSPIFFKLAEGAKVGYIEGWVPIRQNIGEIDTFMVSQPVFNRGAKLFATSPSNVTAEIKKAKDLEPFLEHDRVKLRVLVTAGDKRPVISHVMIRYKTSTNTVVSGDVPRSAQDLSGMQFGIIEAYQETAIFFDGKTIPYIQTEDLLIRLEDLRRFKIVSVNNNRFGGVLTSIDTVARYIIPTVDIGATKLLM